MTTLGLTRLWVNLVTTGEGISGASDRGRSQSFTNDGRVVKGANGRVRAVTVVGENAELSFTFVVASKATRDKLRTWKGQAVCVRDHKGDKWYGIFLGVTATEYLPADMYAVGFTLLATTTVEGV